MKFLYSCYEVSLHLYVIIIIFIHFVRFLFLLLQFMMPAPIDHVVVCWHGNKVAIMMKLHFVDVITF